MQSENTHWPDWDADNLRGATGKVIIDDSEDNPYAGLNRAQRRKAMSVERKAAKHGRI